MKHIVTICFTIGLLLPYNVKAQDKNLEAQVYYNKAEAAFNAASYEAALGYITAAEGTLGNSNSKLLYLKIKTLDLLVKIDNTKLLDLQRSIAQFYQYTDQNNPKWTDRYLEVTEIDIDLKKAAKEIERKQQQEEIDFAKTKSSNALSDYQTFFYNYPNSKYKSILLPQSQLLEKKEFDQKWKEENLPLIAKYRKKGNALVASGSALLVSGAALLITGTVLSAKFNKAYTNYDDYLYNKGRYNGRPIKSIYTEDFYYSNIELIQLTVDPYGSYKEQYYDKSWREPVIYWSMGALAFATGIVVTPIASKYFKKSIQIKKDGQSKKIDLSYCPSISPQIKSYGVNLCLNF